VFDRFLTYLEVIKMNYHDLTVDELRSAARSKGLKGAKVVFMKKDELIYFLETGAIIETGPETKAPETTPATPVNLELLAKLAELLTPKAPVNLDPVLDLINNHDIILEKISAKIKDLEKNDPGEKIKEIQARGSIAVDTTGKHEKLPEIVSLLQSAKLPLYLVGPAGTGKTTLAEQAAQILGFDFSFISVSAQTTESKLLGFISATGSYISTEFRRIYENGGVFLLDEIDNGNANVLAVLNSALANCFCAFPDGTIKKHENFRMLAAANTYGTGPDRKYIGRNKLDAATLDRFYHIDINYSDNIENSIVSSYAGSIGNAAAIYDKLKKLRSYIENNGLEVVASTRGLIKIYEAITCGQAEKQAVISAVFKGNEKLYNQYWS